MNLTCSQSCVKNKTRAQFTFVECIVLLAHRFLLRLILSGFKDHLWTFLYIAPFQGLLLQRARLHQVAKEGLWSCLRGPDILSFSAPRKLSLPSRYSRFPFVKSLSQASRAQKRCDAPIFSLHHNFRLTCTFILTLTHHHWEQMHDAHHFSRARNEPMRIYNKMCSSPFCDHCI